jgi:hypothetical protein
MTRCPSTEELRRLLADGLSGPEAEAVEAHVEVCAACQQALEQLTGNAERRQEVTMGEAGAGFLVRAPVRFPASARRRAG